MKGTPMAADKFEEAFAKMRDRTYPAYHWIAVRCAGQCSDIELLAELGFAVEPKDLRDYLRLPLGPCLAVADSGEWLWVCDSDTYALWNSRPFHPRLAQLGQKWDVLQRFLAECDNSHQFAYYRDGHLVREFFAIDGENGMFVHKNVGDPLPGESAAIDLGDYGAGVSAIAANLGITTSHTWADVRLYALKKPTPEAP